MTKSSQFCKVCDSLIPGSAAGLEKLEKRFSLSREKAEGYFDRFAEDERDQE